MQWISDQLLKQRGNLFHWIPVAFGSGIGIYFAIAFEPSTVQWVALFVAGVASLFVSRFVGYAFQPVFIALFLVCAGMGVAKVRTEAVTASVLSFRYYGPIEGRVVHIDRSASDAVRLTLDQPVLFNLSPERTPERIRISVHGEQPLLTYLPGDRLILTGHLSPPSGPAEPGGFDFQRHAWFAGLGAVGYTRTPVLRAAPPKDDLSLAIFNTRFSISSAIQQRMPEDTGAFATAITTGDRSAISQDVMDDLRAANLAHLLAISGLHMGLLTGFIFVVLRYGLAVIPRLALNYPTKKIAAGAAIIAGLSYLALSGGNVATIRAFVMVAVMFVAVILDRRALTLRAVAIAAMLILLFQPEASTGPGFQMSFAATTALVFVFSKFRFSNVRLPKWARKTLSVVLSSAVAGMATAPFAAAHFNLIAHYGLLANVLSVPLMGVLVMPAAVLAALLSPIGLEGVGLFFMDLGLRWIIFVAQWVASMDGAVGHVWAPDPNVLPLFAIGFLFFILWQGRLRFGGLVIAAFAFALWTQTDRPTLLIADNGGLIGLQTESGRALSKPRGSGFVAGIWLENDGQPVAQDVAAARDGISKDGRMSWVALGEFDILHTTGKTALEQFTGCNGANVLISNQKLEEDRPCTVIDINELRRRGSMALDEIDGRLTITSARDVSGVRPWNATAYRHTVAAFPTLTKENGLQTQPVLVER